MKNIQKRIFENRDEYLEIINKHSPSTVFARKRDLVLTGLEFNIVASSVFDRLCVICSAGSESKLRDKLYFNQVSIL